MKISPAVWVGGGAVLLYLVYKRSSSTSTITQANTPTYSTGSGSTSSGSSASPASTVSQGGAQAAQASGAQSQAAQDEVDQNSFNALAGSSGVGIPQGN